MNPRLYELCWQVETDVNSFYYYEFKVSCSEEDSRQYGKKRETELNDGMSIEERSQDGFFYKFIGAHEIEDIDGFTVVLNHQ